jgi:type 1 fimbria pilin
MNRRLLRLVASGLAALGFLVVLSAPASAASIAAQPSSVAVGGTVTMSGDVLVNGQPGCQVQGTVTLISPAFEGLGEFAGAGAVNLPVDGSSHFSAPVHLSVSVPPGTYDISGRCGGGNLGVTATLTITGTATPSPGLADTGPATGGRDLRQMMLAGFVLIAVGAVLIGLSRPRFWRSYRA